MIQKLATVAGHRIWAASTLSSRSPTQIANARTHQAFWINAKLGLAPKHIAGLIGCSEGETSLLTGKAAIGDHDEAFGPFQIHWRDANRKVEGRGQRINRLAGFDVRKVDDLEQGLKATLWELTSPESWYKNVLPTLLTQTEMSGIIRVLVTKYEQSANQASDIAKRTAYAMYWLDNLTWSASS